EGGGGVALGDGEADVAEHAAGVVLVLRDLDGDGAGPVAHGGLDAAQVLPQPELHQRVAVQPAHGDAAAHRLFHDGGGGGAQPHVLAQVVQLLDDLRHVERLAGDAG